MVKKLIRPLSLCGIILIAVALKSATILFAGLFLLLGSQPFIWTSKKRLFMLFSIAGSAIILQLIGELLVKSPRPSFYSSVHGDTLFAFNPHLFPKGTCLKNSKFPTRTCIATITAVKPLQIYYTVPSAGWQHLTEENTKAFICCLDSLKKFILVIPTGADEQVHYKISSMLYSIFSRNTHTSYGQSDSLIVDISSPPEQQERPDLGYWYPPPDRRNPYLIKVSPLIIALLFFALVPFIAIGKPSFFRAVQFFPPIISVFITYHFIVGSECPESIKLPLLAGAPLGAGLLAMQATRIFSGKVRSIMFMLWCLCFFIYKDQVTSTAASINSGVLFAIFFFTILVFAQISIPRKAIGNFKIYLSGLGTGYLLLILHPYLDVTLLYPLSTLLIILTQSYGLGRMRAFQ